MPSLLYVLCYALLDCFRMSRLYDNRNSNKNTNDENNNTKIIGKCFLTMRLEKDIEGYCSLSLPHGQ